jgi:hypothetical protein
MLSRHPGLFGFCAPCDSLACPAGHHDIALEWTQEKTPLPAVLLLFLDIAIGVDCIENIVFPVVLSLVMLHCMMCSIVVSLFIVPSPSNMPQLSANTRCVQDP